MITARILLLVGLCGLSQLSVVAGEWMLLWDDINPAGSIARFDVTHVEPSGRTNAYVVNVPRIKLPLNVGTHRFSVVAVGTNSVPSDPGQVEWFLPKAVVNLRLEMSLTVTEVK